MTQLEHAVAGRITREMRLVAEREGLDSEELRKNIARGWAVITANPGHEGLRPLGIGKGLCVKVNANIGTSPIKSDIRMELEKLRVSIEAGADTVMDLSLGEDLDGIRRKLIRNSEVPLGTVPIYQAVLESGGPEELTLDNYLEVLERQAKDGVDFVTVHAGVTKKSLPLLEKRLMPPVSRGGTFLVEWMKRHGKESFLYEHFDKILRIARKYDMTISLGDGLRPGCIRDATDDAQLYELKILGELSKRCRENGVQSIIEGPGHIPLHEVEKNVRLQKRLCDNAPFYVLGPLPTDIAAGYDHIACAIGGALAGMHGADFLCYVTPREHIGLPGVDDVREGTVASRIAAHIADVARGRARSRERDDSMSEARSRLDWNDMGRHALDPARFRKLVKEECASNPDISEGCSMCGKYCTEKRK